jgi:5-methylcytosine-specific restriction endonuclease McrA
MDTETIAKVCDALSRKDSECARKILGSFTPALVIKRRADLLGYTRVFIRDGFIDRYSGNRLVFPPVLRMLSHALPDVFPYHPNWKTQASHPAYWELSATIDHLNPVAKEGPDNPDNWITTSMARNSAKKKWSLEELGWKLLDPGKFEEWDGLLNWCMQYWRDNPEIEVDSGLGSWLKAGKVALSELKQP